MNAESVVRGQDLGIQSICLVVFVVRGALAIHVWEGLGSTQVNSQCGERRKKQEERIGPCTLQILVCILSFLFIFIQRDERLYKFWYAKV